MRWVRAPRRSSAVVVVASSALAASALAAGMAFPAPLPAKAQRIIERDWCSPSSYSRAGAVKGVTAAARRSLADAERVARARPHGCLLAERFARRRLEATFPRGKCPRGLSALGPGARRAAAAAAAAFEGRAMRPVIVGYGSRLAQVRHACGRSTARRTVVVSMSLTAMLPSASLSERDVAVSHVRGGGWRVWSVLH
jgi:hypothetical protein